MLQLGKIRTMLFGPARDPLDPGTRQHIALIAFFAWVGLGADGLSSSCYGPEEAFLALGHHTHLGLYLALATALTVFIISLAYNQVIELFPSGGGGYKVASQLIGPYAGLVSGAALIVDYVLTIAISIASGADALFSLLPLSAHAYKSEVEIVLITVLIVLNLRGMKEAIKFLLPIFVGFVLIHVFLIGYGIFQHAERLPSLIPNTINETLDLSQHSGWIFVVSTLLLAYSQGGGTYTGLEAVSNNVNTLAEPRVATGKWTMFYMATSLAFMAGGIIMLYLLWQVAPVPGQTLNAVTFKAMMTNWQWHGVDFSGFFLTLTLLLEGGLLFVAANTGFLGGPAVLSNMAADQWVPHHFGYLSSRLVTKYGVVLMGAAALAVLLWSKGSVALLVVLYSINVFLTFSLSLFGLCIHWWRNRRSHARWVPRLLLSLLGLTVTVGILSVLLVEKFESGGWVTVLITGVVVALCLLIKRHYIETAQQLRQVDALFAATAEAEPAPMLSLDPALPTAIFMVGKSRGTGMHTLLWVQRMFPGHFKNFIFLSVGEVDSQSYGGEGVLERMQHEVNTSLDYYVNFCRGHSLPSDAFVAFGTDTTAELTGLAQEVAKQYSNNVFFASKLIFIHDNWLTRILHNQTALTMQRRLHLMGLQMVILPMKI